MYSDLNELYGKYGKNVAKAIYQEESTGTHASKKVRNKATMLDLMSRWAREMVRNLKA